MANYGPTVPHDPPNHNVIYTRTHLKGYASKMVYDLKKVATLYNGLKVRIFTIDETSAICTNCTDSFTGQILMGDCPICKGTGHLSSYTAIGDFYVVAQLSPRSKSSSEMGDMEVSQQNVFELIDVPLLEDQALLAVIDTKRVYKIIDMEPSIVAVGGAVITQMVTCSALPRGSQEYTVITW